MNLILRPLYRLCCIISILHFTSVFAYAAGPTVAISPRPGWVISPVHKYTKPTLRTVNNGFLYSLIEEQNHVEEKATYTHVIRDIISEVGIQNGSNISLSFDPDYERVEFHQLTVWRDQKPLNRLSRKVFKIVASENDIDNHVYHGKYTVLLLMEDIRKGDQIEYSYTIKGINPIFKNKFSKELYIQEYNAVTHFYVSLISSKSRLFTVKTFQSARAPKITEKDGLKRYEWETFNVPAPAYEDNQPAWFNNFARIQVSEYRSWAEVVKWGLEVNPIPAQLKGELLERVEQIKKQTGREKEKYFRKVVKVVQDEVRYLGIEMGERSHRASAPETVYKQRYGDCKDKSLLLAAMLHAGGIPARLALINTSYQDELFNHLPSPRAFNHMVVVATIHNQDVWIDPTISYQGGEGADISFPDYKAALILQKGYSRLVNIPSPAYGKIRCTERYFVPDENSRVRLDVETVYTSEQADVVRAQLANLSLDNLSSGNLDYYAKLYPDIETQDSMKVNDDRISNRLTVTESYMISNFFQKDPATKRYNVGFYGNFIKEQLPSISPNRKNPVSVNYPYDMNYNIIVVMNSPWDVLNENVSVDRDSYRFNRSVQSANNTLYINFQFAYKKNYLTAEKVREFADDIRKISDSHLSYTVSYQPGLKGGALRINYVLIVLAILLVITLVILAIRIYKQQTVPTEAYLEGYGRKIGGWLVLVIIGFSITPIRVVIFLLEQHYFTLNLWELVPASGNTLLLKSMLVYELSFNILIGFFSLFCVFLLLKKRDIAPKFIIAFYAVSICGLLLDAFLSYYLLVNSTAPWQELVKSVVAAAIWIPYFLKSGRVQETFIVPYPRVNFAVEKQCEEAEQVQ